MSNILEPRMYYKPFEYPRAFELYEQHESLHWLPKEVPLAQDIIDWNKKLNQKERDFLTQIFRFFTQADTDVAGAYAQKYLPTFRKPEVRMMLLSFAGREAVHQAAYSHLIDSLGMPEITYKQFLDYEVMREKHDYFENTIDKGADNIIQQMVAISAMTEGVQLFASFIMLLNFTRFNKMNGMGQIVTWSIRDEDLHCEGMTWLFRQFIKENREVWNDELKAELYGIAEKMIDLEDKFIDLAFNDCPMEGLTAEEVKQYIRYIADRRLIALGLKGIFRVKHNPLPWVEELLSAPEHAAFFETRATEYSKGNMKGTWSNVWK